MIVFLIIVAVLALIISIILSISATLTVIYDGGWTTKVKVLWIEKDIELTKILSFVLFPKENAEMVKEQRKANEINNEAEKAEATEVKEIIPEPVPKAEVKPETVTITSAEDLEETVPQATSQPAEPPKVESKPKKEKKQKPAKPNYIKSLWDKEGIVGILGLVINMLETANSAIITFFRGFHIYSFYVKIIVGGGDAASVAQSYGTVCKYYYPFKGAILNGMHVDNYDDLIMPDFLATGNEYGLQFIGSVSVRLLLKVGLSAGKTFLINLIKNK
jgi:hypothetical protein